MGGYELKLRFLGENTIIAEWPEDISTDILTDLLSFRDFLMENFNGRIAEIINTYNSLTLFFNGSEREELKQSVVNGYRDFQGGNRQQGRLWKIPVCYDEKFGIDLKEISNGKGLAVKEIIERHSSPVYTVYFIGFLPGFLYLGGMDSGIAYPRKNTPRPSVKRGAVGIAGGQTGIYPDQSPAGWNIIGNSPVSFFDPKANPPCFGRAGDRVKFHSISAKEHAAIRKEVKSGKYIIEQQWYEG